ncbi:(Fe-S)-binding protein [Granulibacter bethesdensis]|uniref:(Fe-S)-binding protein n=1 Tax=Granulibacter bethesdensis TaxID=364410 RepID=UPI0003F1DC0D|nr:(Fe-S)-binding protein [Granulibacter bethesdensis]AHJ64434.1 Fumarate reductase iron-sulfur protein [Granulibacter bethesdensis CGDNIH4]
MHPGTPLLLVIWFLVLLVIVQALRIALRWRVGQKTHVDWVRGLIAMPRRYLVDVHHVVERRPENARMHKLVAGGLLAGSVLTLLSTILPVLHRGGMVASLFWIVTAAFYAFGLSGARHVSARRSPTTPPHLSAGRFLTLPLWLGLYLTGGLIAAIGAALHGMLPDVLPHAAGAAGAVMTLTGGLALVAHLPNGPMRHAVAGSLHLAAHPRPGRFEGGRDTALLALDLKAGQAGVSTPADFTWNRLASFDACIQCGRCEQACPAFAAGQPLNPKKLIQDLTFALHGGDAYTGSPYPQARPVAGHGGAHHPIIGADAVIHPDTLWSCTTCRACVHECPMLIEHVDAIVDMRRFQTLELGAIPEKAAQPLHHLRYADDAGGRALASRTDFTAGMTLRVLEEQGETDILLWLGEGAFDLRYGRSLRALIALMQQAGVDFAVLGAEERDCGDLARRLGDEAGFQRLAQDNIATLKRRRFRRIVTADPHALHTLRNEYRAFGATWPVLHHTALLDEFIATGKLNPVKFETRPVTYHDPCYLARYNGEVDAPRRILDRLATHRVEMERHGERAMCCGGGGGAPVTDIAGEKRIPDIRMSHAQGVGASIVAVGCPGCTAMLEGVTGDRPEVKDIAELLLDSIEHAKTRVAQPSQTILPEGVA